MLKLQMDEHLICNSNMQFRHVLNLCLNISDVKLINTLSHDWPNLDDHFLFAQNRLTGCFCCKTMNPINFSIIYVDLSEKLFVWFDIIINDVWYDSLCIFLGLNCPSKSFCSSFSVIVHMCVSGVIQIKTFSWNSVNEEKTYSYFTSNSRPNDMINLVLHYCVCDIDPFRVEKWRQLELIRFCGQNNLVCND